MRRLLVLTLVLVPTLAAGMEAVVTKVIDGDTIETGGQTVRLQGIDAPERDQPHGLKATASLQSLILNRRVRLEVQGTDQYGRLIAVIYREGRNVNRWLAPQDHSWECDRYSEIRPSAGSSGRSGGVSRRRPGHERRRTVRCSPVCGWRPHGVLADIKGRC